MTHPTRPPALPTDLTGRVVFVAGGGSAGPGWSIGRAACVTYARQGARVCVVDRDAASAEETTALIHAEGGEAVTLIGDVALEADVLRLFAEAKAHFGPIDVLHHNVGIEEFGELTQVQEDSWDRVHAINLKGPMLTARAVVPHMIRQGGGSIVNISSIASRKWSPMQFLSYSTSKAALNHMTRVVARQYAPHHVRCNVILPGLIDTPHAANLTDGDDAAKQRAREARHARCPMGHQGTPWDVAHAALFLASDESKYVTGIELVVDGGLSL